ncbi:MAG: LptF/LptG family permease [Prevotella sp.]|nr:LptF/LptG family permease [Prevotella sp.]MDY4626316.1 LptF/LptG family permease [Prevotella sp.]
MLRVRKLDIFIMRQFGLLFVGTFFICQFVLMMQFLWQYIDTLIGKGLTLDIMAQFFWYLGLMLVPQALPLAILLSSLITYGNLGESSELTAIKAAGISLFQSFRSLIIICVFISISSFVFQNNIGPASQRKITQLLIAMKQKSPELEILEGVFYDGIPQTNIYVQHKDMNSGKLYGIMIYRMTESFEDAAIILADSGMMQSTAEKKHLLLTLWNGEWFENMNQQQVASSASVPYRRESFVSKRIVLDFDGTLDLDAAGPLSTNARTKSLSMINTSLDSLRHTYDSIGTAFYKDARMAYYVEPELDKKQRSEVKAINAKNLNIDTLFAHMSPQERQNVVSAALSKVQQGESNLEFKQIVTKDGNRVIRQHEIERIRKFTVALSCLIFFFIGAPLGAIIRKGGLGVPIIVSVLVFIVYYILDNTGYRMARGGMWTIWFGELLSPAVLIPLAVFVAYKANNDSTVFNWDASKQIIMKALGLRLKRHISSKEVIINAPDYKADAATLTTINAELSDYVRAHNLKRPANPIDVFFRYQPDHEIERISKQLETVIEDLGNTRDKVVITELNKYPILAVKAHTRPFEHRWMNIVSAVIVPAGLFFYIRMWAFRLRLLHDLRTIRDVDDVIVKRINEMNNR